MKNEQIEFSLKEIETKIDDLFSGNSAKELPHHSDLSGTDKDIYYRYDGKYSNQHWGTKETVNMAMNLARNWKRVGGTPLILLGDISSKIFGKTKGHKAHKTGTHLDVDLAKTLPRDPGYGKLEQTKCLALMMIALRLGTKRILFSDSTVVEVANAMAKDENLSGRVEVRADHDNHFHLEMPL